MANPSDQLPKTPIQSATVAQLQDTAGQLDAIQNTTADDAIYQAANLQYSACESRLSVLLSLQLRADSDAMAAGVAPMNTAKQELDAVLKNVSKADALISAMAKYLSAADTVIQAAKVVATTL